MVNYQVLIGNYKFFLVTKETPKELYLLIYSSPR